MPPGPELEARIDDPGEESYSPLKGMRQKLSAYK